MKNQKLVSKVQTFLGSVLSLCQMQFLKYIPPSPLEELFVCQWKDTFKQRYNIQKSWLSVVTLKAKL